MHDALVVLRTLYFWCSVGLHVSMSAKDCERLCTNFRACCSANGKLWNRLNISLRKVELGYKALLDIDGPGPDDQEMMEEAMLERDGAAGASRGSRVCPEFCGATGFPPSWRQGMHVSSSLYDMATDDAQRHADTLKQHAHTQQHADTQPNADTKQHARSPTPSLPQHLRIYSVPGGGGGGGGGSYSAIQASISTSASASTCISALTPASLLVRATSIVYIFASQISYRHRF